MDPYNRFGTTNVYTAWRPLVEDFDVWGAMMAMVVVGMVAATASRGVAQGRTFWVVPLGLVTTAVLISSVVGPFSYNNLAASWVLVGVAVSWARRSGHSSDVTTGCPTRSRWHPIRLLD